MPDDELEEELLELEEDELLLEEEELDEELDEEPLEEELDDEELEEELEVFCASHVYVVMLLWLPLVLLTQTFTLIFEVVQLLPCGAMNVTEVPVLLNVCILMLLNTTLVTLPKFVPLNTIEFPPLHGPLAGEI